MRSLAIRELRTPYRSPWFNPFAERVNGTLRRELTDHVLALIAPHLQSLLREYVERYYNPVRTHMSLDGNASIERVREETPAGEVIATPVIGGLYHTYRRASGTEPSFVGRVRAQTPFNLEHRESGCRYQRRAP
jgi:putative transposase